MTAAPIPQAVIDGGMAAVGLLVCIAVCKYLDHLPVYRIEQIAARQGVPLARSTLGEWIWRIRVALQLDPGSGKTRHAYLWAYRSNALDDGPALVVFDYQASRASAHTCAFLQDWRGHLMVDDYAGYVAAEFMLRRRLAAEEARGIFDLLT